MQHHTASFCKLSIALVIAAMCPTHTMHASSSSPHCHSWPPRHPQISKSPRPGLSVFQSGQLDITCGQGIAALVACLIAAGSWLQPETATFALKPASAQQKRAAVHALEKQLMLGGCLAQHRRMHSYMRNRECQSELQRLQDIDLHGRATLAAASQRASLSETELEEVRLLCAMLALDMSCRMHSWEWHHR